MVKKEVTREQVIEAVSQQMDGAYYSAEMKRIKGGHIADALGLEEPKPFERVMWAAKSVSGKFFVAETQNAIPCTTDHVFPVLVTELPPDDARIPR